MLKKFEGFSSHLDILKDVKEKAEKAWNRIIKNSYKGTITYKFKPNIYDFFDKELWQDMYDKDGNLKMVIVKVIFDTNRSGTYVKKTKWNRWLISINMMEKKIGSDINIYDDEGKLIGVTSHSWQLKTKDKVFSELAHEITHIGQNYNGFSDYTHKKFKDKFATLKSKNKKTYNKFYDDRHSDYPTEKEAVLMEFFELLKRDKIEAFNLMITRPDYFDLYSYKKMINKAIKYGVDIKDINFIKDELTKYLTKKVDEIKNRRFFFDNLFKQLKHKMPLFIQFNISYKEKFKELEEILKNSTANRIPNLKNLKKMVKEITD